MTDLLPDMLVFQADDRLLAERRRVDNDAVVCGTAHTCPPPTNKDSCARRCGRVLLRSKPTSSDSHSLSTPDGAGRHAHR